MGHDVAVFQPYPFQAGQKIRIEGKRRRGDWLVVQADESKVKLRCPISLKEFEWDTFCYLVKEEEDVPWPQEE